MGDIADQMLDGSMCQWCGEPLDGDGYAQVCAGCQLESGVDKHGNKLGEEPMPANPVKATRAVPCPVTECKRTFRDNHGMGQHVRDKHGDTS